MKPSLYPTYPGFTRRAITFTIDDGIIKYDEKFISILCPHGFKGTFNLCSHFMDREDAFYRNFYSGFGIANHTHFHPFAMDDDVQYITVDEPLADQHPADDLIYPVSDRDGFYNKRYPNGWREIADNKTYINCIITCQERLERVFGKDVVKGFVWPYCEQNNSEIKRFLSEFGFTSVRRTGDTLDVTGFALPADKMSWSYNCHDVNLLEIMEKYERCEDDGTLKFFAFGVHSVDFERSGKWGDLHTFAEKYGDRPNDFWYATVDEIFDYAAATERLLLTDTTIENPTELTIYVQLNGENLILPPKTSLNIK